MMRLSKVARLTAGDWALLAETAALLVYVRLGLRVRSFAALARSLDRRVHAHDAGRLRPAHDDGAPRVAWAVNAMGRRLPGTTCLAEALTAHALLRRRGYAPTLRIGARANDARALDAHAWVECGGIVVVGTVQGIEDYAVLT